MVAMANTRAVKAALKSLADKGCTTTYDGRAGTAVATDTDGQRCYQALQKGRGGPWIVRCTDTTNVKWSNPMDAVPARVPTDAEITTAINSR